MLAEARRPSYIAPAMPDAILLAPRRSSTWKWLVCGLLLLATMLNYMDRLTLSQTASRVTKEFHLSNEEYGLLDTVFSVAFGLGAVALGWVADRYHVRLVYPAALLAWSLVGFATGFADSFLFLLACRGLLGFTEAGHWPCALRTTQHILPPDERTLGNSILQGGAAVGAVLTPLIVQLFLFWTNEWRYPFMAIGGLGVFWAALWLLSVDRHDLAARPAAAEPPEQLRRKDTLGGALRDHRFWLLMVVVVSINLTWHFFRHWMPLFLQRGHGYSEETTNYFTSAYYLATGLGSFCAGFGTLWLVRRRFSVHGSRMAVFAGCTLLTTLSVVAAQLERGPLLLMLLLVIGFGALGLFPNYYSFSQELTVRHQGKVTGLLGLINWLAVGLFQWLVGKAIDQTDSYALGLTLAGLTPLIALTVLVLFWGKERVPETAFQARSASEEGFIVPQAFRASDDS
jgi:ACS family hexuronate transporter-like MFS transporter